jgi:osmotically-inducible protein OsmY
VGGGFRVLPLGLCMLAACSSMKPGPGDPTDAATARRVEAALAADPVLAGRQIAVTVQGGTVHLKGVVQSTHDLLVAEGDAKSVPGVLVVDEEGLFIARGGSPQ